MRGDDYHASDSRNKVWNIVGAPDLTGATITVTARDSSDNVIFTKSGTVVTPGAGTQVVSVALAASDTSAKTPDIYDYDVEATLATSSRKVTLVIGRVTLLKDYTHA